MTLIVPDNHQGISNGNLISTKDTIINQSNKSVFVWETLNPINNYNITLNIADYISFSDTLDGHQGFLDLDYFDSPKSDNFIL